MQRLIVIMTAVLSAGMLQQESPQPEQTKKAADSAEANRKSQAALTQFHSLVGDWRGVGQPKRSSMRGAWTEKVTWRWDFSKAKSPALFMQSDKGKLVRKVWLRFDETRQLYVAEITLAGTESPAPVVLVEERPAKPKPASDSAKTTAKAAESAQTTETPKSRIGKGRQQAPKLVLKQAGNDKAYRVTLRLLSDKRVTILLERGNKFFSRVGGIGYTRSGESLANRGDGKPVCIVTGGAGTIKVAHKGKTYFVCCSGCQQAFEDDPEGVLADYRAQLEEEKQASAKEAKAASP